MPYALRIFQCAGCGRQVGRRASAEAKVRCIDCGIARSVENMQQLHRKSGPFYQRWIRGITAGVAREQALAAIAAEVDSLDWPETG